MISNPFEELEKRMVNIEAMLSKIIARISLPAKDEDTIAGISLAVEVTGLKQATIYCKVSKNEIPHFKRGGRLYFSKATLIKWMTEEATSAMSDCNKPIALFPHFTKAKK